MCHLFDLLANCIGLYLDTVTIRAKQSCYRALCRPAGNFLLGFRAGRGSHRNHCHRSRQCLHDQWISNSVGFSLSMIEAHTRPICRRMHLHQSTLFRFLLRVCFTSAPLCSSPHRRAARVSQKPPLRIYLWHTIFQSSYRFYQFTFYSRHDGMYRQHMQSGTTSTV